VLGVCSRDSETIESRFPTLLGNKTNNGGNVARNSPQEFATVVNIFLRLRKVVLHQLANILVELRTKTDFQWSYIHHKVEGPVQQKVRTRNRPCC
jgi:hypothetical protein